MLAVAKAWISKQIRNGDDHVPRWPEPPVLVSLSVFSQGTLTPYMDVPVPRYMTADQIGIFFGLFFCGHLDVTISVFNGLRNISIHKMMGSMTMADYSLQAGRILSFMVKDLTAQEKPEKEEGETPDGFVLIPEDHRPCPELLPVGDLFTQIDTLKRKFKELRLPYQGLEQLARAIYDGYFPLDRKVFSPGRIILNAIPE